MSKSGLIRFTCIRVASHRLKHDQSKGCNSNGGKMNQNFALFQIISNVQKPK